MSGRRRQPIGGSSNISHAKVFSSVGEFLNPIKRNPCVEIGFFDSQGKTLDLGLSLDTITGSEANKCSGLSGIAAVVSSTSSNTAPDRAYQPSAFVDLIETSK